MQGTVGDMYMFGGGINKNCRHFLLTLVEIIFLYTEPQKEEANLDHSHILAHTLQVHTHPVARGLLLLICVVVAGLHCTGAIVVLTSIICSRRRTGVGERREKSQQRENLNINTSIERRRGNIIHRTVMLRLLQKWLTPVK